MIRLGSVASLVTAATDLGEMPFVALESVDAGTGRLSAVDLPTVRLLDAGVASAAVGDVLFGKLRPYLAKTWRVDRPVYASTELMCLRPRNGIDSGWLGYVATSRPLIDWAVASSDGAKMPRTSWERLRQYRLPVPRYDEQRAIAYYLDRETARIDALIAAKQYLLSRLAEREPAYVEESVRRGLWPTVALRRVIVRMEQGWSPQCDARLPEGEEWGVLKVGCVNGGWFKANEVKALPADLEPRTEYTVRDGDLLMSRANTKDLVGSVALASSVRPRTLLSDKLYRIELDETRADPRFVCLWLQTRAVRSTFELDATGASDSMQNIGQDTVRRVVVPLPPKAEQAQLVAACESQRAWARLLSLRIRRQIDLLTERRRALITAAVTGEIAVPIAV